MATQPLNEVSCDGPRSSQALHCHAAHVPGAINLLQQITEHHRRSPVVIGRHNASEHHRASSDQTLSGKLGQSTARKVHGEPASRTQVCCRLLGSRTTQKHDCRKIPYAYVPHLRHCDPTIVEFRC